MTLTDMLTELYNDCNYGNPPATTVTARLTTYLNQGLRRILSEPGMTRLQDSDAPFTFATVANTIRYVFPESVAIIKRITERTNQQRLVMMTPDDYRRYAPDPTIVTGTPEKWVPMGRVAVALQPSDASEIFVKSSSAGDTTQTVFLEGIITGGYQRTASVTLTGVTAVSLSSAITSWIEVTDFYLSAPPAGTVTLLEDSGAGTELARITIGAKRPRYQAIALWPTPAAILTYYVDYRREVLDLVNASDEPPLPTDLHWVLTAYARMREYEKVDDHRYQAAQADWQDGVRKVKNYVLNPSDYRPVQGKLPTRGGSNLGAWYPDGIWPGISY